MSTYHTASLVYGYDLGSSDEHFIKEVGKWGSLDLPWMARDEEGFTIETLTEAFHRRLFEAIPDYDTSITDDHRRKDEVWHQYGVKVLEHGWLAEGSTASYALIAHEVSVDGGDAELISLPRLIDLQEKNQFDDKLDRALKILGVTPKYDRGWHLLATR